MPRRRLVRTSWAYTRLTANTQYNAWPSPAWATQQEPCARVGSLAWRARRGGRGGRSMPPRACDSDLRTGDKGRLCPAGWSGIMVSSVCVGVLVEEHDGDKSTTACSRSRGSTRPWARRRCPAVKGLSVRLVLPAGSLSLSLSLSLAFCCHYYRFSPLCLPTIT